MSVGKEVVYKEDATRGNCILKPKTYKGDAMIQVWLDSRMLATLDAWLVKNGVSTRFMSDVVRESLRALMEYVVETGDIEMIDETTVARDLLKYKFKVNLNPNDKGKKNLLHNLILTEGRPPRINPKAVIEKDSEPITGRVPSKLSDEEWTRVQERIAEEDAKDELVKKAKQDAFYRSVGINPKDEEMKVDSKTGVVIMSESNTNDQYTEKDRLKDLEEENRIKRLEKERLEKDKDIASASEEEVRKLLASIISDNKKRTPRKRENKEWPNSTAPIQHSRAEVEEIMRIREEKDKKQLYDLKNCNNWIHNKDIKE